MKDILITGAAGFIGKNLVEKLQTRYNVFAPSIFELDLTDSLAVETYIKKHHFDAIIHTANYGTKDEKNPDKYKVLDYGLRMFFNLERCNEHFGKLIYYGSGAEYCRLHWRPFMNEKCLGEYIPTDEYGMYKFVLSKYSKIIDNVYELILFGVAGKYEMTYRFLSSNVCRALKGMPLTISKNAYFDYIDVEDVIRITEWFINNDGAYHNYNVCRGEHIDLLSLAAIIRDKYAPNSEIQIANEGYKQEYSGDNSRLVSELGNISFTPYEVMIDRLVNYYRPIIDSIDGALLP